MGNKKEKKQNKKCKRKIRIRLADPNIPDSYVCEIFDSSLENEDEPLSDFLKSDDSLIESKDNYSKPKNYFEILMSNECRKSVRNNSANEVPEKLLETPVEEKSVRRKDKRKKKKKTVFADVAKPKDDSKGETAESSEDESLFQIQRKLQEVDAEVKRDSCGDEIEFESDEFLTIFDSPKADFSKKKTLSILNYFSPEANSNSNKFHKSKCKKLGEIKNCQAENNLKSKVKQINYKIPVNGINKENVKLAPLFHKKEKKAIDTATQKARREFLFKSSQPLGKKVESKPVSENSINFPTTAHIQQRDDSIYWSSREIRLPPGDPTCLDEYEFVSDKKFRIKINGLDAVSDTRVSDEVNIDRGFLCKVKCKYADLDLSSVIDGLAEKWDKFAKQTADVDKSKSKYSSEEPGFEVFNTLWTEKYKPRSVEILGNDSVVKKLRKWLQSWKTFDEELKALIKSGRKLKNQKENDDSDDFLDSDDDFGLKAPGNVCLLSGPNGCGKTSLIFALANELEFSVLEVNASSKRTGKKVLSDLHEATQSHKVHRVNLMQSEPVEKGKKKKKMKKRKKTKKTDTPAKILDQTNDCKISLILIEDADIVFEDHDEGFVSAIASLVQTSKRPLIFLSNESSCLYLDNFKTDQCLILKMEQPSFYKSCAVLDVVSSLEGASLDKEILETLLRRNNFDLRKSLLELQFWIQTGLNTFKLSEKFDLGSLWWGSSKFLYGEEIGHFVKPQTRKRKRMSEFFDSSEDEATTKKLKLQTDDSRSYRPLKSSEVDRKPNPAIHVYSRFLDSISILDRFRLEGNQEPVPGLDYKPKDSLSLEENMEEASWTSRNLTGELTREMASLSTRIFTRKSREKETEERKLSFAFPSWEEIRWRKSQEEASEELSVLVPANNGRDRRSLSLDYLPAIRGICRVERNRLVINPKRKNRFYHYLNNLGVELTDENLDVNCEIFES